MTNSNNSSNGNWITINNIGLDGYVLSIDSSNSCGWVPIPVASTKKSNGCTCKKCQEFYPYAEPNQKDGTLICFSCRMEW